MSQLAVAPVNSSSGENRRFFSRLPLAVYALAVLAGLLHMMPVWRAQSRTPAGWTFTGNVDSSPDYIQYRSWMRQSQGTGMLMDDRFTSEANRRFLPVTFYYALGKIATWTRVQPEFVFAYAGGVLAIALTILLFLAVQHFFGRRYEAWWVFLVLMFGGGLGSHYKLLARFQAIRNNEITRRLFVEPIWDPKVLVFEDYRGHYIFTTFFDTHYLLVWLVSLAAVLSLYFALKDTSAARIGGEALLFALATWLHIYEAITLSAIAAGVAFFYWRKGLLSRPRLAAFAAGPLGAAVTLAVLFVLQHASGIPLATWREVNVVAAMLFMAYPVAWIAIAWRGGSFWGDAGPDGCFLLGWAVACTAITLSGPFYPYPDRGTMTLEVALYLIAGMIYFSRYARVTRTAALVIVFLTAATPMWCLLRWWNFTEFGANPAYTYLSPEHRQIIRALLDRAVQSDVLLADDDDVLWLAPEYPGRHYCGHFFLTVDYEAKKQARSRFFAAEPLRQADFLAAQKIRFLYVAKNQDPARFAAVPGLSLLAAGKAGALFEYNRDRESLLKQNLLEQNLLEQDPERRH
jgi:hypothetical protein